MKTHEQFGDDLALYALDELTGAERQELEEHLQGCAACRRELQGLRSDLGLLGLSSSGPQPPARSKERLTRAIAAEPRGVSLPTPAPRQRSLWAKLVPAVAILGMALIIIVVVRYNQLLRDQIAELSNRNSDLSVRYKQAQGALDLLQDPKAVRVSLNPQKASKQPSGTAIFSPSQKRMMFMASNLAPVPQGKAYELWIIPAKGAPIAAGVFKPDDHGNAIMMDHKMPEGVEAKAFAITVEKEEGSDKPTSPILLMGAGE